MGIFKKLSDTVVRKFKEIVNVSNWQIESDMGWTDIKSINKTVEYEIYILEFESGRVLKCADNHIIIDENYNEVFAKDSLGLNIMVKGGSDKVVKITATGKYEEMYDFELAEESNHLYYADGVLSHNTTLMTIYALWLANFFPDQNIIICADKASTASMIFERIQLAYKELPGWIKCPSEEFNKRSMTLKNGSHIVTSATTDSAIRGNSLSCLIVDEFAFVDENIADKFWTSVTPTLVTNPNAKMFVSSTPNGVGNMFWSLYDRSEKGLNDFKIQRVTWQDIPGRDEKWKKRTIETDMNGDINRFQQEYECKFIGASNSPFPPHVFEYIETTIEEPKFYEDNFKIWKMPEEDRIYSIGVDVSEGIGKDRSVIQIFDMTDLTRIEQVATYSNANINTTDFTEKVLEIAKLYGNPLLSVERNGSGTDVCQRIYNDNRYMNFVCHGTQSKDMERQRPGIICSNNTKYPGIINMKYWLCDTFKVIIHDREFLDELRHFERKPNNKWGAEYGFHDDLVMAAVWSLNVLHRNLVNRYFIVESLDEKGKPIKVRNKFKSKLEDSEYKKLIYAKFADKGTFPIISFGKMTNSKIQNNVLNQSCVFSPLRGDEDYEDLLANGWTELTF